MSDTAILTLRTMLANLDDAKKYQSLRDVMSTLPAPDLAAVFEDLPPEKLPVLFRLCPKDLAAEIFAELTPETQQNLIDGLTDKELKAVVDDLFVDDATDLVEEMPANVVKRILGQADPATRRMINELLKYPEDSAGGVMTTELMELRPDWTVAQAMADSDAVTIIGGGDSAAGMQAVNSFCQAHGYDQTHMGRMLLASNENDDNYTSVGDCGHLLQEIYKQDTSGYTHAADMFNLLKAQTRCNKIPAQLPEGVKTANKTGELDNVENDAGILYDTNSGNDLVICFLSENLTDTAAAQSTIAQLSRTIYLTYNG